MPERLRCLTVAVCGALTIATRAAAQVPLPNAAQPRGSGHIVVRIVAADNGAPVRRAFIRLAGRPPDSVSGAWPFQAFTREGETDDAGRLDFADLPGGVYGLTVDPLYGFVRVERQQAGTLADGETLDVIIRLERTGAIAGRIVDEGGTAVVGARVQILRRTDLDERVRAVGASTTTDDLGQFRVFNVPAGDYYVLATHTPWHRDKETSARAGYATTYYPSSSTLDGAARVSVRAGQDTTSVDVRVPRVTLARVVVQAVDSRGLPLGREAQLSLSVLDPGYSPDAIRYATRRDDGTFLFRDIPPGRYPIIATTGPTMEEAAYVNVSIGAEDVSMRIQTNRGATVSGRVVLEPSTRSASSSNPRPRIWVSAHRARLGLGYEQASRAELSEPGRFELRGLRGPMNLVAEVSLGALVSIRNGSEELSGKTLEFSGTEVLDDVVVTLTTDVARVDLAITNTAAQDGAEPVLVVLFAEDASRWHQGWLQYARRDVGRDVVHVELGRMNPGRYLVVALRNANVGSPTDPSALAKLRRLAVPVTLVGGETVSLALNVVAATP
jgi:hypothetical protein